MLYVAAIADLHGRGRLITDELNHYAQIALFRRGDFRVYTDYLTTIPGYHALVAALEWLGGADSLGAARLINAGFGLAAAAGFHAVRRRLWPGTETLATAQLMLLPILVPLFFVVYTDVLALALLLWATCATLRGRHGWSALALLGLVGVRQHEVVWAAFLAVLAAWPVLAERGLSGWRAIAARAWPYALPLAAFLAFWRWNGSISLSPGQAALHPDFSLHAGNLFFALFLAGLLLPLHVAAGLPRFAALARRQPWVALIAPIAFAAFWWGFRADNPYNTALPSQYPRNALLLAVDGGGWVRAAFGLVAVLALCGLAATRLRPRQAVWLHPFAALFLAASWLVEQRYALVPLVLWLAFREHRGRAVEYATAALWLVLAVLVFHGIASGRFSM